MTVSPVPAADARERLEQALFEIRRVIAGQDAMLERVLVCLLAQGHLLIEGVPGLAKTLTIKTTASVLGGSFARVQFTPDLVPSDLVGTRIYRPGEGAFDTELGPVFCNFLLADEINRAPAKVQSALLEVMQERQVTIGHTTYPVPEPFLAMATQNPIESEGTYPLPEAQIDRFMLKILIGYPSHDEELTVVQRQLEAPPQLRETLTLDDLRKLQRAVFDVYVDPGLVSYAVTLADATRNPAAHQAAGARAAHHVRREPARADQPRAGRARAGAHARPRLRRRRRPARAREGRDAPPARALVPGARRGGERGRDPRSRARAGAAAASRPHANERGLSIAPATQPGAAGPGAGLRSGCSVRSRSPSRDGWKGCSPATTARAFLGQGSELAQIRPYTLGDDVRQIDWNVTARTGEPHIRVQHAERVLVTWLVLDTSPSMNFGTAERRKADVAEGVAIAVGHVATRRGNRLGVVTFGDAEPALDSGAPGAARAHRDCSGHSTGTGPGMSGTWSRTRRRDVARRGDQAGGRARAPALVRRARVRLPRP